MSKKSKKVQPDIVGMSGVLTLALESMKKNGRFNSKKPEITNNVKIIIGGNPVTEELVNIYGADAYTTNAAEGCKNLSGLGRLSEHRN